MAAVRSFLARVGRLERAMEPTLSPFEKAYGSLDAFEAEARAAIHAGALDCRDGCTLLHGVRRWHADGVWVVWQ